MIWKRDVFPDRNTTWRCRKACVAPGKSKENWARCKTQGRQRGCFTAGEDTSI